MIRYNQRKIAIYYILTAGVIAGIVVASSKLTAVAQVTITTEELTITGAQSTYNPKPFASVTIPTEKLTITGLIK